MPFHRLNAPAETTAAALLRYVNRQVPLTYDFKTSGRNDDYFDLTSLPLYRFGFGSSYTSLKEYCETHPADEGLLCNPPGSMARFSQ